MKLWGGRFGKETNPLVDEFNSSFSFDWRLWRCDIIGSKAHVRMLGKVKILKEEEAEAILNALDEIYAQIEEKGIEQEEGIEDIHTYIENKLIEKIGDVAKKMHTARSRNDQVALDLRLYLREEIDAISSSLKETVRAFLELAQKHEETIMPGYTHLQKAQAVTLAHYLLAYVQMFLRDLERLKETRKRVNISPLGSGALASTSFPVDRQMVAEELGFEGITFNSIDAVSDRDFAVEFLSDAALIMIHLSRLAEEIILWSTEEFSFVELDDAFATGSSMMPQKKNPDVAELIRGKSGRVIGHLTGMLTLLKGLPLAYNKDLQEDKEALFDAVDILKSVLKIVSPFILSLRFKTENLLAAAAKGFTNATDAAEYLVLKGVPFREAHRLVGEAVKIASAQGVGLENLSLKEWQKLSAAVEEDIYQFLDLKAGVERKKVTGGPSPLAVKEAIAQAYQALENL